MKKIAKFKEYFEKELGQHQKIKDAFNKANANFKSATGIDGYSNYHSFYTTLKKKR